MVAMKVAEMAGRRAQWRVELDLQTVASTVAMMADTTAGK